MPGWGRVVVTVLSLDKFETGRFVIVHRFQSWIGHRRRAAADDIANPELVFRLGRFANTNQELAFLAADLPLQMQGITQV